MKTLEGRPNQYLTGLMTHSYEFANKKKPPFLHKFSSTVQYTLFLQSAYYSSARRRKSIPPSDRAESDTPRWTHSSNKHHTRSLTYKKRLFPTHFLCAFLYCWSRSYSNTPRQERKKGSCDESGNILDHR